MKFSDVIRHVESNPGVAGAARQAWAGKTYLVVAYGALYLAVGAHLYQYAFSFDDATAEDWETV